jgi:hypothetical protein
MSQHASDGAEVPGLPDLSGVRPVAPEEHVLFRLAQLVLLLRVVGGPSRPGVGLERLGYYDFFAANPFLVVPADNTEERARLHLAGFDERQLSYASTGPRFANRRRRLQHDVALLVAYDLGRPEEDGWVLTARGAAVADQLTAMYAQQYMTAAEMVIRHLSRLSDSALAMQAGQWLRNPGLLLDLYGAAGDEEKLAPGPDPYSPRIVTEQERGDGRFF